MMMLSVMLIYWKVTVGCIIFVMLYDMYSLACTLIREKKEDKENKRVDESYKKNKKEDILEIDNQLKESESYSFKELADLLERRKRSVETLEKYEDLETASFVKKVKNDIPIDFKKINGRKLYL